MNAAFDARANAELMADNGLMVAMKLLHDRVRFLKIKWDGVEFQSSASLDRFMRRSGARVRSHDNAIDCSPVEYRVVTRTHVRSGPRITIASSTASPNRQAQSANAKSTATRLIPSLHRERGGRRADLRESEARQTSAPTLDAL